MRRGPYSALEVGCSGRERRSRVLVFGDGAVAVDSDVGDLGGPPHDGVTGEEVAGLVVCELKLAEDAGHGIPAAVGGHGRTLGPGSAASGPVGTRSGHTSSARQTPVNGESSALTGLSL